MTLSKQQQLYYIKQGQKDKKKLEKQCHELWREICFLRAKGKCEYQGCHNEATQPHHIKTKGAYPHLRHDIENSMALCYPHHKGRYGAHSDINFKDKILGLYYGFKPIRTKELLDRLDRKADNKYKLDLKAEYLYLQNEIKKLNQLYP
jgi:hypothetical protein